MANILITGCAGFIGSTLAEKLIGQGHRVTGLDNFDSFYPRAEKEANLTSLLASPQFSFIEADINDSSALFRIKSPIDAVVHLAAKVGVRPSIENAAAYIHANITGTNNLLEWMNRNGIKKLVFASSSSIYGNNKKVPFVETDVVDFPVSPYAATKKAGELLNYSYHNLHDFDIVNLRFFTVYGPRQRPDLAIRKFVEMIKQDKPVTLYGDGKTGRDYTYVDDITDGISAALDYVCQNKNVYEIINLGNSSPVLLIDLVNTLYTLLNKPPQLNYSPMQSGDVDFTFADIQKAKQLLGYSPKVKLVDGLKRYLEWGSGGIDH